MIPTMIVVGLVLGRWWWLALAVAGVGWPAVLWSQGIIDSGQVAGAALLAVANAAVGVLIVKGGILAFRRLRHASH
jgi:hypothetical protein